MRKIFAKATILGLMIALFMSCDTKPDTNQQSNKDSNVENEVLPELSVFNLPSKWNTQNGNSLELKDLRGKVTVMVMIYTSCKAACPRLIADMRSIESKVPKNISDKVQYVLVSIDPETDTPERLKAFAKENEMDNAKWIFLQGTESTVREFANVLAVKYKEITPTDFSHSNIISVFNPEGVLVHQQEGLGVDNTSTLSAIIQEAKK